MCDPSNHESLMHCCAKHATNTLSKYLEEELSDIDPDFQFHYSQWQTIFLTSTHEYKQVLIQAVFDIGIPILGTLIWACPNLILSKTEIIIKHNSSFLIKSAT